MKNILSILAIMFSLCLSTNIFADWEGNGFKIIGHTSFVSPDIKNSWIKEIPSQNLLNAPYLASVTVSSHDVYAKIREFNDVISNHGIFIINSTAQPHTYKVELLLTCGVGIRDEVFYIQLNPNGRVTNQYQIGMAEEVDTPGTYDIKASTKVEGIENNFIELHYKYYARA